MKRREMLKHLKRIARDQGMVLDVAESDKHTRISIGDVHITAPHHSEVNDLTAKSIIDHMQGAA